jgi:hypothetical protein
VLDPALVEALDRLVEACSREREGDVVDGAGLGRGALGIAPAILVGEDRDQSPVARIEVEVALGLRSRFGCSKMNGIPNTPSQKSIEVCRSAPTNVM